MRPEPGVGFKVGDLTYSYLAGWLDTDLDIFASFCTALGAPDKSWPRDAARVVLLIWADDGLPEKRYLP